MRMLLESLRERGIPGVHLGVGLNNLGARAFYSRLGFEPMESDPQNLALLGIRTDAVI